MGRSTTTTTKDAHALFYSLRAAYMVTPTNLKVRELLYVQNLSSISTLSLQYSLL
ncbi:hypothetical protein OROGR_008162 [Orobanche gracilis]